ncbi:MAG: hypothetical protein U9R69_01175, partial [Thermodesulfobacteriota bacterium]|nr:hypothetical protein [Thermodesulfobacteriota bacterium]
VPSGQTSLYFTTFATPQTNAVPGNANPVGIGALATGGNTLSLAVALEAFSAPVDLYLGFVVPGSGSISLVDGNNELHDIGEGLVPWMSHIRQAFSETVFSDIQATAIPTGEYRIYLLAVPSGEIPLETNYTLWTSTFVNPDTQAEGYEYKFFGDYRIDESNDLLCPICNTTLIEHTYLRIEAGFDIRNNQASGSGTIWVADHDPCTIMSRGGVGECCLACSVDATTLGTFSIDGNVTDYTSVNGYGLLPTVNISFTENTPVGLTGEIEQSHPIAGHVATVPLYHTENFTQLLEATGFYGSSFDFITAVCDGFRSDGLDAQISKSFEGNITPIPQRHFTGSGALFFYQSPFHIDGDQNLN